MSLAHEHQPATIKIGSIILHRKYKCKVLAFDRHDVCVKRLHTGLILHIPYDEMPAWACG